jgi:hypothetical protein
MIEKYGPPTSGGPASGPRDMGSRQSSNVPNPMLNLQVYQPTKPKEPRYLDAAAFMPPIVPTPFYPPQYSYNYAMQYPYGPPFLGGSVNQFRPPIVNYTINTGGVGADHAQLSRVMEDILPMKDVSTTSKSIIERLTALNFLRSTLFSEGDGVDVDLTGANTSVGSLLTKLKFMDLNPFNSNRFSNNPYRGLPKNYLIYRSCYPIRHDMSRSTVTCAANSMGMLVRIYNMTEEEYNLNNSVNPAGNSRKKEDFDIWRESMYYSFIREHIIKPKLCPNFVCMYGYYLVKKSNIDFTKLNIFNSNSTQKVEPAYINEPPTIPETLEEPTPPNNNANPYDAINKLVNPQQKPRMIPNPKAFLGKAKVILSEAPNNNIIAWASKTYKQVINILSMDTCGYHSEDVWYSVLFQIMVALYIMDIKKIAFTEFKPENNIFIKDINNNNNVTSYWKYKIGGIDYYIPNYGYLVMIDSSFADLGDKKNKKIKSVDFGDSIDEITKLNFETFKNIFNPEVFSSPDFVKQGGVKPPPDILKFMQNILEEANIARDKQITQIEYYIRKFMTQFMNNRIGTYLKTNEKENKRQNENNFTRGQLVVHETGSDNYRFVLFVEDRPDGLAEIITREDPMIDGAKTVNFVNRGNLMGYSKADPILQDFKPNVSLLNEDELLETYIIN